MTSLLQHILADHRLCEPYRRRIDDAYSAMDQGYEKAAAQYGFSCNGCEDSCCRTVFHHHTLSEMVCLYQGYQKQEKGLRQQIRARAKTFADDASKSNGKSGSLKRMCPLNESGRCLLYRYRPMICRLHGIPYNLKAPNQRLTSGPGCWLFSKRLGGNEGVDFDRTPFYALMAEIEMDLRNASGFSGRIKLTVADMLNLFGSEDI